MNADQYTAVRLQAVRAAKLAAGLLANPYKVERYHPDRDLQIECNALWRDTYRQQVDKIERENGYSFDADCESLVEMHPQ